MAISGKERAVVVVRVDYVAFGAFLTSSVILFSCSIVSFFQSIGLYAET
jgi:hypothetical protein